MFNMKMEENFIGFSSKCLKVLFTLDKQVTSNLRHGNVETRPAKSNGITCLILLPIILILYTFLDKVSLMYKITTCISVGLLFYSILFIIFLSTSCIVLKDNVYGGIIPSGLISTMLLYAFLEQDFRFSICVSLLSTYMFSSLLRISLMTFEKTFTIGEAIIVTQAITLYSVVTVMKYVFKITDIDKETEFVHTIIDVTLLTVGMAVALLIFMPGIYRNTVGLCYIGLHCAVFGFVLLHYTLGLNCLVLILDYVFLQNNRWKMFLLWLLLTVFAVIELLMQINTAVKADTVARKSFHVLAALVFLSGTLFDVNFMMLAAGVGFGVILLAEALRQSGIEPVSSALQLAFLAYSDEKDCGSFALTPLYLYCGLWLPLIVVPAPAVLEQLSGVLSTGVGDTAASWGGFRFGSNKWPNTSKTLEGTAFNVLSQVGMVYILQSFELLHAENALLRTLVAATASSLVEANTHQVDNLVLPLVSVLAYQLTRFIS